MAVTLPQREFTDAEIDGMSQAELTAALKNVNKMREESDKLFVQMKATLEAITSADGLSNLAYLMWEPDWKLSANPTVSERISHKKDRTGTVFHLDNSKFYKMLQKWGLSESWYSTIKKFAATQDGRGAYIALRRLYQGDDHIKAKLMEANRRISSNGLSYPGEPEGSFQVYSSNLKEEYEMLWHMLCVMTEKRALDSSKSRWVLCTWKDGRRSLYCLSNINVSLWYRKRIIFSTILECWVSSNDLPAWGLNESTWWSLKRRSTDEQCWERFR